MNTLMRKLTQAMQHIWQKRQTQRWIIPTVIFLIAFLPRALYPVSWSMQWFDRSVRFSDAILAGDWSKTFQMYHPGVTTMWLSGFGLKIFAHLRDLTSSQLLGSEPTKPGVIADAVVVGILPLAITIALSIALSYLLIRRLARSRVAFIEAGLLALDPFYIARSQVLHVDALMATFMLVSALYLLNYVHHRKRSDFMLSGAFGGLAILSKSPALFLVPYTTLVLSISQLSVLDKHPRRWRTWIKQLAATLRNTLLWCLIATVIFIALWPAMWSQPTDVLAQITQSITSKVENPHYNPIYFRGQILFEDPGPFFYLTTLVWRTTPVTLPMTGISLAFAVLQRASNKHKKPKISLLTAYVIFFITQMCLAARKEMRYILPVFLILDVIAAFGIVWTAELMAKAQRWQKTHWIPSAVIAGTLTLQASLILPHHPYYGTCYNQLLGGLKKARNILPLQHEGEGLDQAGQYLNTLPHAQRARVGVHQRGAAMVRRHFIGRTTTLDNPQADYRVYFVNQIMRQIDVSTWENLWIADRQSKPIWKISFGSVDHVWVYGTPPEELAPGGPEYEMDFQLGRHIRLRKIRLDTETLTAGETLTIVPVWISDGEVEKSYKVFCHLQAQDGSLAAQQDGLPLNGIRPTPTWRDQEVMEDNYEVSLDKDFPAGEYELSLGMYDPESMKRLPAYGPTGERVTNDRVIITSIQVKSQAK
jgi:hypothetical protein